MEDQELVLALASFLYEKKAQDIMVLKVSHLTVLCDYLVIASGRTAAQVSALTDGVDEFMVRNNFDLRRTEGPLQGVAGHHRHPGLRFRHGAPLPSG